MTNPISKHTPGPWTTEIAEYGNPRIGAIFARHDIARIVGKPAGRAYYPPGVGIEQYLLDDETDANARLIAAAPELLSALQQLVGHYSTDPDAEDFLVAARNAIARATGERK